MLSSSLIFLFFLCVSGQEVVIRNSTRITVNVNEQHFLLCDTNIPNPTYEWLYFIEKDRYLPLISMQDDPRYHFTYPGEGQAKIVCRVQYGDREYESPPVEINVVDNGFVPPDPQFPDGTVPDVYTQYYTEPEPPFRATPTPFEISTTFEIPSLSPDPFATSYVEDYRVTILNDTIVTVPMDKQSFLLCRATFPTQEYEWLRSDDSSEFYVVQIDDEQMHFLNVLRPGISNYMCQVTLWGTTYRSQIVRVEVVDMHPQTLVPVTTQTYPYYTEPEPTFLVTPSTFELTLSNPVPTSYVEYYKVTILNDSQVIVPMDKLSYLLCEANFPAREYEWLQSNEITGYESIQTEDQPRHILNVLEPGVQHYLCQVTLEGRIYRSEIVTVEVVASLPSTLAPIDPTTTNEPSTAANRPSTAEALELWEQAGVNVTILNGSRIHIGTEENHNLVCKTTFPTDKYEWLAYTDKYGYHSIVNQSDPRYKLFYFYPTMHQYECRAVYGGKHYRSQILTVEVSGQIRTQSNVLVIGAIITIMASMYLVQI